MEKSCYLAVGEATGLCVSVHTATPHQGTTLLLLPRESTRPEQQLFRFEPSTDSTFHIVHVASGLVLDVAGGLWKGNPRLILWPRKSDMAANQRWRLTEDGTIRSALVSSHGLTCEPVEVKANLVLSDCHAPHRGHKFFAVGAESLLPSVPAVNPEVERLSPVMTRLAKFKPGQQVADRVEKWDALAVHDFLLFVGLKEMVARVFLDEGINGFQLLRLPDELLVEELKLNRLDLARLRMHLPLPAAPVCGPSMPTKVPRPSYVPPEMVGHVASGKPVILRSLASGKSLRIDKSGKVSGTGGHGVWAQFVICPSVDGHARFQNIGCPDRFLAVRGGKLCCGKGGRFTEFALHWATGTDGQPVVSLRALAEPGGVGILPTGEVKSPRETGLDLHGQFTVHTL